MATGGGPVRPERPLGLRVQAAEMPGLAAMNPDPNELTAAAFDAALPCDPRLTPGLALLRAVVESLRETHPLPGEQVPQSRRLTGLPGGGQDQRSTARRPIVRLVKSPGSSDPSRPSP